MENGTKAAERIILMVRLKGKKKEERISIWTYPNYTKTFLVTVIQTVPVLAADI
jgi:hypothetical protein